MKINAMNQNPRQRYFKGWNKMQRWNKGYDVLNEYPGSGVQMNVSKGWNPEYSLPLVLSLFHSFSQLSIFDVHVGFIFIRRLYISFYRR